MSLSHRIPLLCLFGLTPGLLAQEWAHLAKPTPSFGWRFAPLVFDAARGRALLFGGCTDASPNPNSVAIGEHWEFDGYRWVLAHPRSQPSARYLHAMCYDSLRQRTLLFGGRAVAYQDLGDMWSFDGTAWTQLAPSQLPPPRRAPAMAYDAARDRVVLFGGVGSIYFDDTWEFDGTTWAQVPVSGPTPREGATMAFDAARGLFVMTGGTNQGQGGLSTTWEFDGAVWVQRSATTVPGTLCYDPAVGRVVTLRHEWNGAAWLPSAIANDLSSARELVYDTARGGRLALDRAQQDSTAPFTVEVLAHHGGRWHSSRITPTRMVWDPLRQRMIAIDRAIGETDVARTWDGHEFAPLAVTPSSLPPGFSAYDEGRDVFVVMLDSGGGTLVTELRGNGLAVLSATTAPFQNGVPVYDRARGRVIAASRHVQFFGPPPEFQTWEFDGVAWTQAVTATTPPDVSLPGLAFDPVRSKVVMSGGLIGLFQPFVETWEYDGVDWSRVQTAHQPVMGTADRGLVFDARRGCVIGQDASGTWSYDGVDWTLDTPVTTSPDDLLAFDERRGRVVAMGRDGVWEYGASPMPSTTSYGVGCASSAGQVELLAERLPQLGATLPLRLLGLPPEHGIVVMLHGFDDQQSGGVPLPFDLSLIGGPSGCALLLDPVVIELVLHFGTTVRIERPLPADSALLGAVLLEQGAALDPLLGVPFTAATSNGLRHRLGW
ncbi:MAG: hypothetical protein H6835_20160 [Planctomycetes bacterium]|nr:hypothetical protein [Planctomycetota bacterium]